MTEVNSEYESQVRSYSRSWPTVFKRAKDSYVYDEADRAYLDFFVGAGALNYGHNNEYLKKVMLDYVNEDRIFHSLDMFTSCRQEFLQLFHDQILSPRNLDYKVVFPGPGGANAVEAALKLARKYTGRSEVVYFTNAFHGMTLGALAVTGNSLKRGGAGLPLSNTTPIPFDHYLGDGGDFDYFERLLADSGSGLDKPAAVIVETVQAEGGMNVARGEWLRKLEQICRESGILLIVDDVQMGCGRAGGFFSFEESGINPDMVCLSKSISGYGVPMALTLIKPGLDIWAPGEHNGTFRGIGAGFATGSEVIRRYWSDSKLQDDVARKAQVVAERFEQIVAAHPEHGLKAKGRGLARGIQFASGELASAVCHAAFDAGMLMETSGPDGEVMKALPALTISDEDLELGLKIIAESVAKVLGAN